MLHFHLKACSKCHGDLVLDEGDWLCLQCGTYYYNRLYRTPVPPSAILPGTGSRFDDRSGDRRVKAVPLPAFATQGLSQFPALSPTASGFGETTGIEHGAIGLVTIGPGALGLAAGCATGIGTGYAHR